MTRTPAGQPSSQEPRESVEATSELSIGTIPRPVESTERPLRREELFSGARAFGQELVRGGLALALVAVFAFTVYYASSRSGDTSWTNTKELLQILLPAETGLLGSALGYYFASKG